MGSVLVDLEDDPARVLLPTAPLTGVTALAWAETDARSRCCGSSTRQRREPSTS